MRMRMRESDRERERLGAASDDGVGEGRELRDGFGGIGGVIGGGVGVRLVVVVAIEKGLERVVVVSEDILPYSQLPSIIPHAIFLRFHFFNSFALMIYLQLQRNAMQSAPTLLLDSVISISPCHLPLGKFYFIFDEFITR